MNLTRTGGNAKQALSLTAVKRHLRITENDDDDALLAFIESARAEVETYLGKTLLSATWELKLDAFESEIELKMGPVQSITSIEYVDPDGVTQTLASDQYQFDRAGRLKPSYGNSWPSTRCQFDAVTITYVAGESSTSGISADIKRAMLLIIGAADINREDNITGTMISEIPNSARHLLAPHRNIKL